jgi:glutamyl-Q tRNA(Asp) synthetase
VHRLQDPRRDPRKAARLTPSRTPDLQRLPASTASGADQQLPQPDQRSGYRGRFAPSPTGPLHFGSLIAAVASFADARACQGTWLVRMEDLDRPRGVPGAADQILRTLDVFGLHWDEPVVYQRHRTSLYEDALATLRDRHLTYPCACTRREIADAGRAGPDGPIYPGTCRLGLPPGRHARSERLRTTDGDIVIEDRIQPPYTQCLAADVGDFVLRRADGIHAYQLAVVVDDAAQHINQIVRGADLLSSTPRQRLLQRLLGLPEPAYAHLPVATDPAGKKLSKSLDAQPVDPTDPLRALLAAWAFLGQSPLVGTPATVADFWQQAIPAWSIERIPRRLALPATPVRAMRPMIE